MESPAVFTDDLRPYALWGCRAQGVLRLCWASAHPGSGLGGQPNGLVGHLSQLGLEGSLPTQRNIRPRVTFPSHRLKAQCLLDAQALLALGAKLFPLPGISSTLPAKCRLLGLLPLEESLWLSEPHSANQEFPLCIFCASRTHIWNTA